MKKLMTLAVALVTLAVFTGLGVAQQKGVEKKPPTGVEVKQPTPEPSLARAACEAGCRWDYQGNPAAIEACYRRCGGPEATPARQLGQPPSVTPGGPMEGTTVRGSKSNIQDNRQMGGRVCSNCYVCQCNTGSAGCLCDSAVRNVDDKAKTISLQRKDGSVIVLDASRLTSLPKAGRTAGVQYIDVGGKPVVQSVTVCSGGYWWTVTWGGMTQGGPCSQEGAIK